MGIFNENYHDKYRKYIKEKRYREYLLLVRLDMFAKFYDARLNMKIDKLIKEKFGKDNVVINGFA